jgi:hypothetical protein
MRPVSISLRTDRAAVSARAFLRAALPGDSALKLSICEVSVSWTILEVFESGFYSSFREFMQQASASCRSYLMGKRRSSWN